MTVEQQSFDIKHLTADLDRKGFIAVETGKKRPVTYTKFGKVKIDMYNLISIFPIFADELKEQLGEKGPDGIPVVPPGAMSGITFVDTEQGKERTVYVADNAIPFARLVKKDLKAAQKSLNAIQEPGPNTGPEPTIMPNPEHIKQSTIQEPEINIAAAPEHIKQTDFEKLIIAAIEMERKFGETIIQDPDEAFNYAVKQTLKKAKKITQRVGQVGKAAFLAVRRGVKTYAAWRAEMTPRS